jgi:general secretion pathway protein M
MATLALADLSPRNRRVLAVALAVVALLLALAVLLLPAFLLHKHYDDAIASLEDRLARYRRISAQAPEYRKALDQIRERDGRRFFLKNVAANLAGVELQELVRGAIESNGGRITTSQNQSPRDEGRYRAIGVTFQFFATTPNLQKILFALETQQPYLVVETLTLRPLNAFRGFKPATGQEPELNVQIDVAALGFAAAEKAAAKDKAPAAARP